MRATGCHGFCERGPLVLLYPEGILYQRVRVEDVPEIVEKSLLHDEVLERLLYEDPATGLRHSREEHIPFYRTSSASCCATPGSATPPRSTTTSPSAATRPS